MIREEQEVFIQFPGEAKRRILHPARVTKVHRHEVELRPTDEYLPLEADQNIRVFHQARDFMQQTATVVSVADGAGERGVGIVLTSEAVSAESRTSFRVSTVITELTASVGSEPSCKLVDVSMMGFAVIATAKYTVGEILETELRFEGSTYPGQTCVQSVRDLGAGRMRYGLLPLASDTNGTKMFAGMQAMTTALQRRQLQRLAGVV